MSNQDSHEYGYDLAHRLAREQLARIDIEQQCLNSGGQYRAEACQKAIVVDYLNRSYQVAVPGGEVFLLGGGEELPIRDRILILHYLTQAKGTPLSNKLITYKELPEGLVYFPSFSKRAIKPLLDYFGNEPYQLLSAAEMMGGHKADYGDVAVTINAFPRVPITLVLWQGDAEFLSEGNIIFDASISDYLSIEDINVLCETIAWRLVKLLKAGGSHSGRGNSRNS